MSFGFNETESDFFQKRIISPLKELGFKVYIFGSRARGNHHPFSDIDLLYEGERDIIKKQKISSLKDEWEESTFPYKIDLVYGTELAESYTSSVLKDRIEL